MAKLWHVISVPDSCDAQAYCRGRKRPRVLRHPRMGVTAFDEVSEKRPFEGALRNASYTEAGTPPYRYTRPPLWKRTKSVDVFGSYPIAAMLLDSTGTRSTARAYRTPVRVLRIPGDEECSLEASEMARLGVWRPRSALLPSTGKGAMVCQWQIS